jgi:hypothetical protein
MQHVLKLVMVEWVDILRYLEQTLDMLAAAEVVHMLLLLVPVAEVGAALEEDFHLLLLLVMVPQTLVEVVEATIAPEEQVALV